MAYKCPALPYDADSLEPDMSLKTVMLHYGKHHKGYVDKLNGVIKGTDLDDKDLETIVRSAQENSDQFLFNNAAQVWNHNFFWNSMAPEKCQPSDDMTAAIDRAFDSMSGFKKAFSEAATSQFGSGWCWLVATDKELTIMNTSNADLPLAHGATALLCCDVWEHAYYLDYQNDRGAFVDAFLGNLINWDFAYENLKAQMAT